MQNPAVDCTLVTRDNSGAGKGLGCCNDIKKYFFAFTFNKRNYMCAKPLWLQKPVVTVSRFHSVPDECCVPKV